TDPNKLPDVALAISKYDFQVTLRDDDGGALRSFAEPAMAPFSESAHNGDPAAFARNPICVGPYVLAKPYAGGDSEIRLTRSKTYYGKNVGYTAGGSGYADEIDFRIYPDANAALDGYRKGEVDVVQLQGSQVQQAGDTASLIFGLGDSVEYLGLPSASNSAF